MNILWLVNVITPQMGALFNMPYSSFGGWISGIYSKVISDSSINLSIVFPQSISNELIIRKSGHYAFSIGANEKTLNNAFKTILQERNPDIIHIFGTEFLHSKVMVKASYDLCLSDRLLVNIQGLVSIYEQHFYGNLPNYVVNRFTLRDLLKHENIRISKMKMKKRGIDEIYTLKHVKNVIGRTNWDKACVKLVNPTIRYFHCNEILRESFYEHRWSINDIERHTVFVSQGSYPIKGLHLILPHIKQLVSKYPKIQVFVAGNNPTISKKIYGFPSITSYGKYLKDTIKRLNLENNITFLGTLNEVQILRVMLKSHLFLLSSVIENSPNSLGEAMLLGMPCISTFVGGVSDMINHHSEGICIPLNEMYTLPHWIDKVFSDDLFACRIAEEAHKRAEITHNKDVNYQDTLKIYKGIYHENSTHLS